MVVGKKRPKTHACSYANGEAGPFIELDGGKDYRYVKGLRNRGHVIANIHVYRSIFSIT